MATLSLAGRGQGEGGAGAGEAVGGSGGVKEREDAEMRMLGGRADGQPSLVGGVVGLEQYSACLAGAETIVYDRGLLLLADLV